MTFLQWYQLSKRWSVKQPSTLFTSELPHDEGLGRLSTSTGPDPLLLRGTWSASRLQSHLHSRPLDRVHRHLSDVTVRIHLICGRGTHETQKGCKTCPVSEISHFLTSTEHDLSGSRRAETPGDRVTGYVHWSRGSGTFRFYSCGKIFSTSLLLLPSVRT